MLPITIPPNVLRDIIQLLLLKSKRLGGSTYELMVMVFLPSHGGCNRLEIWSFSRTWILQQKVYVLSRKVFNLVGPQFPPL